jgi:YD repeat-containing protein
MAAYGMGSYLYDWDAANRQIRVTSPQMKTTTIGYDALARVIRRDYANGALTTQTYDRAGNISEINNSTVTALVSRMTYTYDKADKRIAQWEYDGTTTTWTYDNDYRLIGEYRGSGPAGTSFNIEDAYDPAGNRIVQVVGGGTRTTFTYTAANRLTLANKAGTRTTYTYDTAGNRTSEISPTRERESGKEKAGLERESGTVLLIEEARHGG